MHASDAACSSCQEHHAMQIVSQMHLSHAAADRRVLRTHKNTRNKLATGSSCMHDQQGHGLSCHCHACSNNPIANASFSGSVIDIVILIEILRTVLMECHGDDPHFIFHDTHLFSLLILLVHVSKFNVHDTFMTMRFA